MVCRVPLLVERLVARRRLHQESVSGGFPLFGLPGFRKNLGRLATVVDRTMGLKSAQQECHKAEEPRVRQRYAALEAQH